MEKSRTRNWQLQEYALLGPPHPGDVFREDILPKLALSRAAFARQMNISKSTATALLSGKRRVSAAMAQKLASIAGPNALYWLMLQAHYDAWALDRPEKDHIPKAQRLGRRSSAPQKYQSSRF